MVNLSSIGTYLMVLPYLLWNVISGFWRKPEHPGTAYLSENTNFGPVKEEHKLKECEILSGSIPSALDGGQFVRNGPNPQFKPYGNYHWFDGDGMLHGIYLKDGKAYYSNQYVKTERFKYESKHGKSMFITLGNLVSHNTLYFLLRDSILAPKDRPARSTGTANTSIQYHAGNLMALVENDAPYKVQMPDLLTLGPMDTEGRNCTAHPKVDARTGEMIWFGYNFLNAPFCRVHFSDPEGNIKKSISITLPKPSMMHDFSITENYVILLDLPLNFDKKRIGVGLPPLVFDHNEKARIGFLPRSADSEKDIIWIPTDAFYMFHVANSWEESKDEIKLVGCRDSCAGLFGCIRNGKPSKCDGLASKLRLTEWTFNLKTESVTERNVLEFLDQEYHLEFPVCHPALTGYKCRYVYLALFEPAAELPTMKGTLKVDLQENKAWEILHGPRRTGGECFFVPTSNDKDAPEDQGVVMTFVHHAGKDDAAEWVVYDAQTYNPEPLCRVQVNSRIPYGFHGKFMTKEMVQNQKI